LPSPTLPLDAAIRVQKQSLGYGIDDALRVFREWDVDAGSALDLPHFAEKNIQHDAVDWVVCAVEKARFNLFCLLSEAIDTPFTLFKPVGIPWEVIVQNAREEFLKVDALAQTIGGNKNAALVAGHPRDALPTNVIWIFAGDYLKIDVCKLLPQGRAEMFAQV
jgi:hypothetical protein